MPAQSQRPLVAKLLALDPVTIDRTTYTDLGLALDHMGDEFTAEALREALMARGVAVDISTLYRWRREG